MARFQHLNENMSSLFILGPNSNSIALSLFIPIFFSFFRILPQSYEKTSEMQKENSFFFSFPSNSNFLATRKSYEKTREEQKKILSFFFRVPSKFFTK
jgi:hypothetical protein